MKTGRTVLALTLMATVGCASRSPKSAEPRLDSQAAEKAKPYLANHYGLDFRTATIGGTCAQPKDGADWKAWVQASGACVQKQDWSQVEKFGLEMSARQIDSPWGAYFLGVAAANRGELLRAHWMFDLSEKKAGSPIGLVRFERARILEKEEGVAAAAKEMKEAVRLDASLTPAFLWLAQVHHRDRMNAEAEKYYREVIAQKPDTYSALAALGDLMIESSNGKDASDFLSRAIALKPEVAETRAKLAFVYETLTKEPVKALQTLRELRVALDRGRARGKVGFDLPAKIKQLEATMKPESTGQARDREPATDKRAGGTVPQKGG